MPMCVSAALLAFSALCPRAAAEPFCLSVTFTGIPGEVVTPVVVCLPFEGTCRESGAGVAQAGVIVVTCLPVTATG